MSELQWILLGMGLAAMVLIVLWHLRDHWQNWSFRPSSSRRPSQLEPHVDSELAGHRDDDDDGGLEVIHDGKRSVIIDPEMQVIGNGTLLRQPSAAAEQGSAPLKSASRPLPSATATAAASDKTPFDIDPFGSSSPELEEEIDFDEEILIDEGKALSSSSSSAKATRPGGVDEATADGPAPTPEQLKPKPPAPVAPPIKAPPIKESAPTLDAVVMVMAPPNRAFTGVDILQAADQAQLRLARSGSLDYVVNTTHSDPRAFRVGQLRHPNTLDLDKIDTLTTEGLIFFAEFPGPLKAQTTVDQMIAVAGKMARALGGTLCDRRRQRLTTEAMSELRERAEQFDQRHQRWLAGQTRR